MVEQFSEIQNIVKNQSEVENAKDQLLELVAERVEEMMESNLELFFSHLYRMDVDEAKIRNAMDNPPKHETVYMSMARLIVDRELEKIETKRKYKQPNIGDW